LELVVVLAILVALAAILVPLLPEFLGKANQSAAATNMGELEKGVQTFRATYSRYPNYFDSMLTSAGKNPDFDGDGKGDVPVPTPPQGSALMAVSTLSTTQFERLKRQGIKQVYHLNGTTTDSDFHATLNPYGASPNASDLAADSPVWKLARTGAGNTYNDDVFDRSAMPGVILNDDHDYVLFGIGKYCNLCGPDGIVKEAPVFGQHKAQNTPSTSYQRYAAVFDVGNASAEPLRAAKFIGIVALVGKRFFTTGDIAGTYGDNRFDISQPKK
jgi:type II secretory pathway pseudopilin PulG